MRMRYYGVIRKGRTFAQVLVTRKVDSAKPSRWRQVSQVETGVVYRTAREWS